MDSVDAFWYGPVLSSEPCNSLQRKFRFLCRFVQNSLLASTQEGMYQFSRMANANVIFWIRRESISRD